MLFMSNVQQLESPCLQRLLDTYCLQIQSLHVLQKKKKEQI